MPKHRKSRGFAMFANKRDARQEICHPFVLRSGYIDMDRQTDPLSQPATSCEYVFLVFLLRFLISNARFWQNAKTSMCANILNKKLEGCHRAVVD